MPAPELPGLYIHVPFCRTKCPYCDFYSSTELTRAPDFVAALEAELLYYATQFSAVDTVYLGGGTPTALPDSALSAIMALVQGHISVSADAEITIEANPNDLDPARLRALRRSGFNRLSIGVQSFSDAVLRLLGRRHTADEARLSIAQARQAGFDTISLDFMYGIPGQSRADWFATLQEALACSPEHLSCYQLTIKEETPFFDRVQHGVLAACPEHEQAELFMATSAWLESRGYSHYEVSNFCRTEALQARHNRKYWDHVPYLGLGPSAHSFDGRRRWWNVRSIEKYLEQLLAPSAALTGVQEPDSGFRDCVAIKKGVISTEGRDLCLKQNQSLKIDALKRNLRTHRLRRVRNDSKKIISTQPLCGSDGMFSLPLEGSEELTDEQLRCEELMLGLRTRRGCAREKALPSPGAMHALEKLQSEGLIIITADRIAPTPRGMLLADSLAAQL